MNSEMKFILVNRQVMQERRKVGKYAAMRIALEQNLDKVIALTASSKTEAMRLRSSVTTNIRRSMKNPEQWQIHSRVVDAVLYVWLDREKDLS